MKKFASVEALVNIHLSDQTKIKLNEINKIKDSFNSEIQERKTMRKKLRNTLLFLIIFTRL